MFSLIVFFIFLTVSQSLGEKYKSNVFRSLILAILFICVLGCSKDNTEKKNEIEKQEFESFADQDLARFEKEAADNPVVLEGNKQRDVPVPIKKGMDLNRFWGIIEKVKGPTTYEDQDALIHMELEKLSKEDLEGFCSTMHKLYFDIYTWELWAVAYIHLGGCSDDGFMDYRYWLVFQGKDIYERGLKNPDSLADYLVKWGDNAGIEGYGYIAYSVYEDKFKVEMPDDGLRHPLEPTGEEWNESEVILKKRFPKVYKAFDK